MAFVGPLVRSSALLMIFLVICLVIRESKQINSNQFESSRQLFPLRSYREVQIFHYVIPQEVSEAKWRFNASHFYGSYLKSSLQAYSSQMNLIGVRSCEAQNLTVHLRAGSLPIININNASFPENLLTNDSNQYSIELMTNSSVVTFSVDNPLPGDWFGLSYLHKIDDRISQKGLEIECQHKLTSSLSFKKFNHLLPKNDIIVLTPTLSLVQNITQTSYYKFYMNSNCFSAKLLVPKCAQFPALYASLVRSPTLCPISLYTRAKALPSSQIYDYSFNCNNSDISLEDCVLEMQSLATDSWIYVQIEPKSQMESNLESLEITLKLIIDQNNNCLNEQQFDEQILTSDTPVTTYSTPISINHTIITTEQTTSLTPYVIGLTRYDTINSLEFKYSHVDATEFKPNQNVSVFFDVPNDRISVLEFGIIPQSDIGGTLSIDFAISPFTNISQQNYSVTLCLQFERIGFSPNCLRELTLNTSSKEFADRTAIRTILIPFPKPGNWFITLKVDCYLLEYDFTSLERIIMSCEQNSTSILVDIASAPCLQSKCANRGKCVQYLSGGVLFSSCLCKAGWKGWFCNDGSQAIPEDQLLLNFLLLTLSNIMFIPSVILSAYKKFFAESLVYLTTMAASTLYHACDSDYPQSYCLLNLNVLQFGDFYSAILAFWVTLVTLANMPDLCRAFFHLLGGIIIALTVETDRTSLWAFAMPAGVGTTILIISWTVRCCRKSCFPSRKFWIFSILPGIALTAGGLVVYAFFETQDNYAITHSCWHAIMAIALLFLVPSMKTDDEEEEVGGKAKCNAKLAHVEWRPSHTSFKFLNDDIDML